MGKKSKKSKKDEFSDSHDILWSWEGEGELDKDDGRMFYRKARVARVHDKITRTYAVGDVIYVTGDDSTDQWIGQIVEMYERGPDDEPYPDEASSTSPQLEQMRCTLRWFYRPSDCDEGSFRLNRSIAPSLEHEVYFSDHIDQTGFNSLEVIQGRALLCPTEHEYAQAAAAKKTESLPKPYWPDDAVRLVRYFYACTGNPPPMRALQRGELAALLEDPSADHELFHKPRRDFFQKLNADMKGAARRASQSVAAAAVAPAPRPRSPLDPRARAARDAAAAAAARARKQRRALQRLAAGAAAARAESSSDDEERVPPPPPLDPSSQPTDPDGPVSSLPPSPPSVLSPHSPLPPSPPSVLSRSPRSPRSPLSSRSPPAPRARKPRAEPAAEPRRVARRRRSRADDAPAPPRKKARAPPPPPPAPVMEVLRAGGPASPPPVPNAAPEALHAWGLARLRRGADPDDSTLLGLLEAGGGGGGGGNAGPALPAAAAAGAADAAAAAGRDGLGDSHTLSNEVWGTLGDGFLAALARAPSRERQHAFAAAMPRLVRKMISIMVEQNLDFDIGDEQRRAVAEQATRALRVEGKLSS